MNLTEPKPVAEPPTRKAPRFRHIRELDGIRGVAALMVFFHHVCFASVPAAGWPRPISLLRTISISGRYGVDVFFVLSGFLITSLLIDARPRASFYHDFYWKRALRILPLYLICLLGLLLFIPGSWSFVLLSAVFLSNFASLFHVQAGGPFWTLAIEEQFYLLWPTVVRLHSVQQIRRWSIAIGCTSVALRIIAACFGHFNYAFTFLHCDGLALGALLACWHNRRDEQTGVCAGERRAILLAFLAGVALVATPAPGRRLVAIALHAAQEQTGVTLLSGSFIAFAISHTGHRSLALFRSPVLTFFGLISYAMYMIHAYVMEEYDRIRGPVMAGHVPAFVIRLVAILSFSVALSLLSRYVIELPVISLRRYVLARPAHPDPGEPPIPLGNM